MARGSVVDEPALIKALQEPDDLFRRPRRVRQRAAGAEGIDRHGPRRAVPASRLVDRGDARGDGSAGGRQHPGLGRRQAAADAGCRNAVSAEEALSRCEPRSRRCYSSIMTRLVHWFAAVVCACRLLRRTAQTPAATRRLGQGACRHLGILQRRPRQDLHGHLQGTTRPGRLQGRVRRRTAPTLFPLVRDIAAWNFPTTICCISSTRRARRWSNSARSKTASSRRRRRASACCSCRTRPTPAPPPKPPEQVAGDWAIVRGTGPPLCADAGDDHGERRFCGRGEAWLRSGDRAAQFHAMADRPRRTDAGAGARQSVALRGDRQRHWRRVPESADQITLVRQ